MSNGGVGDSSTHNNFPHRTKISLDLDPGISKSKDRPSAPLIPLKQQPQQQRYMGGFNGSSTANRLKGIHQPSKPLDINGISLGTKGIKENDFLPNSKHWFHESSSTNNNNNNSHKYTDFEDHKTNGFGNLSKCFSEVAQSSLGV